MNDDYTGEGGVPEFERTWTPTEVTLMWSDSPRQGRSGGKQQRRSLSLDPHIQGSFFPIPLALHISRSIL